MTDPNLSRFQATSYPELATAVRIASERVIRRWQATVQEILPDADELTWRELRNRMPETLQRLAKALESTSAAPSRQLLMQSEEHGACRFHQNYNLAELLLEYDLLRPILTEEVVRVLERDPTLQEILALTTGMDMAARRSIIAFVEHQREEIQNSAERHAKYLSFLAHDLRGGLNSVLMVAELLRDELKGREELADSLRDLETMRRNILNTVAAMNRFLQAEQLRRGKIKAQMQSVDLRKLIDAVITHFYQDAKAKGLELTSTARGECTVTTDSDLLLLILQNLVSNAVKYSAKGRITVRLEHDETCCTISIADQGPGIPEEAMARLFEPYVRGENGGHGVGLGLAIAHQAAGAIAAELTAESKPGCGATFRLRIPL